MAAKEAPTFTAEELKAAVEKAYLDGFTDSRAWPNHRPELVEAVSPPVGHPDKRYFVRVGIAGQTLYR